MNERLAASFQRLAFSFQLSAVSKINVILSGGAVSLREMAIQSKELHCFRQVPDGKII
jgi:hypothetical protein